MDDAFALDRAIGGARSGLIVGAGYIGLECAEALKQRGLAVTVVEQLAEVLPTVDAELGAVVRTELVRNGVEVRTGTTALGIRLENGLLTAVRNPVGRCPSWQPSVGTSARRRPQ